MFQGGSVKESRTILKATLRTGLPAQAVPLCLGDCKRLYLPAHLQGTGPETREETFYSLTMRYKQFVVLAGSSKGPHWAAGHIRWGWVLSSRGPTCWCGFFNASDSKDRVTGVGLEVLRWSCISTI